MPAYHNVSHIADTDAMGNAEIIIGRYTLIKTIGFQNLCDCSAIDSLLKCMYTL